MFENVLGQNSTSQLISDINSSKLSPAMLFAGPPSSGKGTASLELARVLSCEKEVKAAWDCSCSSCARHRLLIHPDLLCLGLKSFCAEISASSVAVQRDRSGRVLFIRSVRKLLARFNPFLWEDDPRASRISSLVSSMDEDLNEFEILSEIEVAGTENSAVDKLALSITKSSYKLESEGISDNIPIGQIRRSAYWSRLAPSGNRKLLVIENADRMQDEARNSLLKILEEPPQRVNIVLCTTRPGSIIPTILSRLRAYRFVKRDPLTEDDVIRRVFKDPKAEAGIGINAYLDSFLPVSKNTINSLAAYFTSSIAYKAALLSRRQGHQLGEEALLLGRYSASIAEAASLGRHEANNIVLLNFIMEKAEKFEVRSLFSSFLQSILDQVSHSLKQKEGFSPKPAYLQLWIKNISWAENAAGIYRIRPVQVLEKLYTDLSRGLAET